MNIFKQLIVSLYSPKDIATFRLQKKRKTILYLMLLTLIAIIPISFFSYTAISEGINISKTALEHDVPDFEIRDGIFTSESDEPVYLESNGFTVILDSSGTLTPEDILNMDDTFALLQHELVISMDGAHNTYEYSQLQGINISKQDIEDFVQGIEGGKTLIISIFVFFIYLFSLIGQFIDVTIIAIIGLLFKNILQKQLTFGQIWRLSAYSVTLPTIFFTLMEALKTEVPFQFIINWGVALIMLYLAMKESESNITPNYDEY